MIIETELEEDGRWLAEIPGLPGAMVYADSEGHAVQGVKALALRIIADRIENGEPEPELGSLFAPSA
jgi:predicted RNase H-like HicB family nuclease